MTSTMPASEHGATALESFIASRAARPAWRNVPLAQRPATIAEGYRLQGEIHEKLAEAGNHRLGYKVGATSKPGQANYGITEPVYAGMLADNAAASLAEALARPLMDPGLECEVAVTLARTLDARQTHLDPDTVRAAIESCHLACEIIDFRYGDAMALGVPTLIADDFFHAGFVLGPANDDWQKLDLADLSATMEIDGTVYSGHSQDVLDPITSLQWLATALAREGRALQAGDIVLTGTIVTPTRIRLPARSVTLSISGFEPMRL
jgi:2-keto-4-pentenoate hydratase